MKLIAESIGADLKTLLYFISFGVLFVSVGWVMDPEASPVGLSLLVGSVFLPMYLTLITTKICILTNLESITLWLEDWKWVEHTAKELVVLAISGLLAFTGLFAIYSLMYKWLIFIPVANFFGIPLQY
jgi:hypothetical protein